MSVADGAAVKLGRHPASTALPCIVRAQWPVGFDRRRDDAAAWRRPGRMHAQLIRPERYGDPQTAFAVETVPTPRPGPGEVARLRRWRRASTTTTSGRPSGDQSTSSPRARKQARRRLSTSAAVMRRESSGRSAKASTASASATMLSRTADVGFDRSRGSLRAATRSSRRVRGSGDTKPTGAASRSTRSSRRTNCSPSHRSLSWAAAAAARWSGRPPTGCSARGIRTTVRESDVVLIWGGSGGLGSQAIQIAKAKGAIPVAVTSGPERGQYCIDLGARGYIDRRDFSHWGVMPELARRRGVRRVDRRGTRVRQGAVGCRRRASQPAHRVRASWRGHDPDVDLRLRERRHGRDLRGHHRLSRSGRPALSLDAAEAAAGLALRQR